MVDGIIMDIFLSLAKDKIVWMSLFFLISSGVGFIWILKLNSSQKKEKPSFISALDPIPDLNIEKTSNFQTHTPNTITTKQPANLDSVAQQLEKVQSTLNMIVVKINQINNSLNNEAIETQIENVSQAIKNLPAELSKKDQDKMLEITNKMNQIYQILSTLSKPN